ncbi:MAG: hypothetical protein A2365_01420 [Candidatus Nealsonbacteria bacterium RIFOXYB1_FULL_40_15]|uniref:EamA domain-containing protein n=2 Tax=Candidatus Nealsoniibacteriota TaxID=1817911 RepID=A0A1G2EPZ7_9BACT|nr:MAG: hypothetical protein A2365_01420 [Candidatus Nealsonbacteria bacterium RIFOXYB1_FULL_40_15]OGZ27876.1 MAG: hypothetical protein A2427_04150 [Candidatus Nealsonbacteria bacterium RIFOXYC1_FULL_40_7]OGZ28035.1 MAG: hypothetical protein A2562_01500 [Candidatus Nealsonbacteria bacterium RIFOXYD1_FULL_39_11]
MNILLFVPAIGWLLISALFFVCGEFLSKLWGNSPSIQMTIIVIVAYAFGSITWLPALLHKNHLATMGTLWLLLATAATIIIGVLIFHEKVTALQGVGIFLALVSMILLNL